MINYFLQQYKKNIDFRFLKIFALWDRPIFCISVCGLDRFYAEFKMKFRKSTSSCIYFSEVDIYVYNNDEWNDDDEE